jgi:hypothetical protein
MTLQCMRLKEYVTLNVNNNISMAAVFLDIEKAFDTIWHSGLLCKLSKLEFSTSLIKLISSFLSQRKFTSIYTVYRLEIQLSFCLSLFLTLSLSRYMFRQ